PLRQLYEELPAEEFSPLKLKAVRQTMVAAGWCRTLINQRIGRIIHAFKWAVSEELIPEGVWRALTTVRGLQRGRTEAHETEPVQPVATEVVEKTTPYLLPEVAALVRLQLLTGMRPGEVCIIRPCDIDRSGSVWVYRPAHHKNSHRGHHRAVALGPQAQ